MRHSSATLEALHDRSTRNRDSLEGSRSCGCFHCKRMFEASAIKDWIPESDGRAVTALCPFCGIDSVVPAREGESLGIDVLKAMHAYWFERVVRLDEHPNFFQRLRLQAEPLVRRITWDLWQSRKNPD